MLITLDKIKKLDVWGHELDKVNKILEHYPEFSGNLKQFIELENIDYITKVWVVSNLFSIEQSLKWINLCSEFTNDKKFKDAVIIINENSNDPIMNIAMGIALDTVVSIICTDKLKKKQKELNLKLMLECI